MSLLDYYALCIIIIIIILYNYYMYTLFSSLGACETLCYLIIDIANYKYRHDIIINIVTMFDEILFMAQ